MKTVRDNMMKKLSGKVCGGIFCLMLVCGFSTANAGRWGDDLHSTEFRTLNQELRESGNIQRAIKVYSMFVKIDDEDVYAHYELGNSYMVAGEFEKAEAQYRRAICLDPKFSQPYAGLANVLVQKGRANEALNLYERSIEISRGELATNVNLWTMVARTGSIELAIRAYKYRLENKTQLGDSYLGLGIAQAAVQMNGDAIRSLQMALRFNPSLHQVCTQLANIYNGVGQHERALTYSEKAAQIRSSMPVQPSAQIAENR